MLRLTATFVFFTFAALSLGACASPGAAEPGDTTKTRDEAAERPATAALDLRRRPVLELETAGMLKYKPYKSDQVVSIVRAMVAQVERDNQASTKDRDLGRQRHFRLDSQNEPGKYIVIDLSYLRLVHSNIAKRLQNSKLSGDFERAMRALLDDSVYGLTVICRRKVEIVVSNGQTYLVTSVLECDTTCDDPNANCEWVVVDKIIIS